MATVNYMLASGGCNMRLHGTVEMYGTYAQILESNSQVPVTRSPFTDAVSPQILPSAINLTERVGWSERYG